MDFTAPYWLESLTLVSRAPKERDRSLAVFWPFTMLVSKGRGGTARELNDVAVGRIKRRETVVKTGKEGQDRGWNQWQNEKKETGHPVMSASDTN